MLRVLREEVRAFALGDIALNCFAGETPVMTKSGTRPIRELAGAVHDLLTEGGLWVQAPVRSFGQQELMKVVLSRNKVKKTIYATPSHIWLLSPIQRKYTRKVPTVQLAPGDRLSTVFPRRTENLSISLQGVARGFVFGDGSVSSTNRSRANFCGQKDQHILALFIAEGLGSFRCPNIEGASRHVWSESPNGGPGPSCPLNEPTG